MITLSNVYRGLSSAGGSTSCTSRPAPAIRLAANASQRSASLIRGPRPVLTITAFGYILAMVSLLIMCLVWSFNGQCNVI